MTIPEACAKLDYIIEGAFLGAVEESMLIMGKTLRNDIRDRVQHRGVSKNETPFSQYGKRWRNERKRKGLQVGYKDFTFTGDMFGDFGVRWDWQNNQVKISLTKTKNRMKENSHDGYEKTEILAPSEEEIRQAEIQFEKTFEMKLKQLLQ